LITHLADSDWVIEYLRGRDEGIRLLQPLIASGSLATSIIVYAEIYEGILGDANRDQRLSSLNDFLAGVPLLGIDREAAEEFARLRSELRARGELLADHDTWIAATALRHDVALLARDQHFDRIAALKRA
jgi:predicted nucleic acid-binding protein